MHGLKRTLDTRRTGLWLPHIFHKVFYPRTLTKEGPECVAPVVIPALAPTGHVLVSGQDSLPETK